MAKGNAVKRFMRLRFKLRCLLLALALISGLLAVYVWVDRRAEMQIVAVKFFESKDCVPIEASQFLGMSSITIKYNGLKAHTMRSPRVAPPKPTPEPSPWYERIIGEDIFQRYTVLQIPIDSTIAFSEIESQLSQLHWIEKLLIDSGRLSNREIEVLRNNNPLLDIEVIEGNQVTAAPINWRAGLIIDKSNSSVGARSSDMLRRIHQQQH